LAGKDSSPRSGSAGAVAQGSLDPAAFRVIDCLDQVGSCSSARQFVDGVRQEAAIQGVSLNIVPRLVLVLPFQLHHRQAVTGPANCTGFGGVKTCRQHDVLVGVFVVREQYGSTILGPGNRDDVRVVVVVADLG